MGSTVDYVEKQFVRDLPRIHPNPSFVGDLKQKLAKSPIFQYRHESSARIVLILFGLLLASLLLTLGVKINQTVTSKKDL